jgi:hypothetical protein
MRDERGQLRQEDLDPTLLPVPEESSAEELQELPLQGSVGHLASVQPEVHAETPGHLQEWESAAMEIASLEAWTAQEEEPDWDYDTAMSQLSDQEDRLGDLQGEPAEGAEEQAPRPPGRKRRAAPVDCAGAGQEVEATKHRLRQRRKGLRAYWKHRLFTCVEAQTIMLS